MNKFMKWMEEKGYCENVFDNGGKIWLIGDGDSIIPTNKMLIGYMMEYLMEKGVTDMMNFCLTDRSIEGIYKQLEKKVEREEHYFDGVVEAREEKKVREINDFELTHVSLNSDESVGMGGKICHNFKCERCGTFLAVGAMRWRIIEDKKILDVCGKCHKEAEEKGESVSSMGLERKNWVCSCGRVQPEQKWICNDCGMERRTK